MKWCCPRQWPVFSALTVLIAVGSSQITTTADKDQSQPDVIRDLPFSTARRAGDLIFLSGEIPMRRDGTPERGDTAAQTRQTMNNMRNTLRQYGCTFDDVVKVTVFLRSMDDYQEMNAVYRTFFSGPFPARECVGGLEIAFGCDLEMSAIAYSPKQNQGRP